MVHRNGLLTYQAASKEFGRSFETLKKLVHDGQLREFEQPSAKPMLRRAELGRLFSSLTSKLRPINDCEPPADAKPAKILCELLDINEGGLRYHLRMPTHPALGRSIRTGFGSFISKAANGRDRRITGLLISETDVRRILDLRKKPFYKEIPGNPGRWLTRGTFLHSDGRLFHTARHVYENFEEFGFPPKTLDLPGRLRKLEWLNATFPDVPRWSLRVFSLNSLERLRDRRAGKVGAGRWHDAGIWRDDQGKWFSTACIAGLIGESDTRHFFWKLRLRIERYKLVPAKPTNRTCRGRRMGQADVAVFHEDDVTMFVNGPKLEPTKSAKRNKPGPKLTDRQMQINELCFELQKRVRDPREAYFNRDAVFDIEATFGLDALGSEYADFDTKKRRLRLNAEYHAKHLKAQ